VQEAWHAKGEEMSSEKFVVRVVRPVFQTTYLEVEGRDENEACSLAFQSAYNLPEESWSGSYDPEDYVFDVHCVRSGATPEGDAYSLLDFPRYSILSSNQEPAIHTDGYQPWMNYLHPLSVASQISHWIEQLEKTRSGSYEEGIEALEETLREWKGTDNKVVPLVPPEHLRQNIEYVEALLETVRLLNDVD